MKRWTPQLKTVVFIAFLLLNSFNKQAVAQAVTTGLLDPALTSQFNTLELRSAQANQATYNILFPVCVTGSNNPACTPAVLSVFKRVRELVDTANAITGHPGQFSLGVDTASLGFALRWTAPEETSAQGSMTTQFANSQRAALASHISALRMNTLGIRLADNENSTLPDYDSLFGFHENHALGGGASADSSEPIWVPWGAFANGAYAWGSKQPTVLEDAFDYDGSQLTLGLDRRINEQLVIGLMAGYTNRQIDFNSSLSVVDGGIKSNGFSAVFYGAYNYQIAFVSASLGGQWLSYDSTRRITYPSQNPNVASVDETARSNSHSHALTSSLEAGLDWQRKGFTAEPYLRGDFQYVKAGAFRESGAANGFDMQFQAQTLHSFDCAAGLKLQYALTPSFGVIVPFVRTELHHEFSNNSRTVSGSYLDAGALLNSNASASFNIPTDKADTSYYQVAVGTSMVMQHGLQAFAQYSQVFQLDNYSDHVIAGGIRIEF